MSSGIRLSDTAATVLLLIVLLVGMTGLVMLTDMEAAGSGPDPRKDLPTEPGAVCCVVLA